MMALLVIGCIFVAFVILLSFSLTFYVTIKDEVEVKVGAFGFQKLIDFEAPESQKKKEKHLKKEAKEKAKIARIKQKKLKKAQKKGAHSKGTHGGMTAKVVTANTFGETVEMVLTLLKSSALSTTSLLSHVRITRLKLYMTVCDETANETAISYGTISAGIYNLLGQLDHFITVKIKSIDIIPDFVGDEEIYDISFKVKLRINLIIGTAISIFFKFLVNIVKLKANIGAVQKQTNQGKINNKKGGIKQ